MGCPARSRKGSSWKTTPLLKGQASRYTIREFMLCCICKEKEATVHLTQIAGDKMQKVDLCEECAKTKGVNDPTGFSLADLLLGLGASQEIEQAAGGTEIHCSRCNFTQADFKKA